MSVGSSALDVIASRITPVPAVAQAGPGGVAAGLEPAFGAGWEPGRRSPPPRRRSDHARQALGAAFFTAFLAAFLATFLVAFFALFFAVFFAAFFVAFLAGAFFAAGFFSATFLAGLLAETAARGLAGFFQQFRDFLQRQRCRLAVLGDLAVELAVADVRTVAAVEHLDVAAVELLDDAVAGDLFLLLDQGHGAVQVDGVGVVFLLQRGVHAAALGEGAEAADADGDVLVVVLAQLARQLEQLQRVLQGDRVDALARAQRGERRLLLVLDRADLHQRPVAAEARADRLAATSDRRRARARRWPRRVAATSVLSSTSCLNGSQNRSISGIQSSSPRD